MTTAELERIARDIVPPRGAGFAVAVVDHTPGGKLSSGVPSGLGGRTAYRVAFLVDGVSKSAPVGPPFARPREATAFARYLNGQAATPRPAAPTTLAGAGEPEGTSGRLIGAPEPVHPPAPSAPERPAGPEALGSVTAAKGTGSSARVCASCGRLLPPGSRSQRRTCSAACRRAAARAARKQTDSATGAVPLSERSTDAGPAPRSRRVEGSPGPTGHAESRRPAQTSAPRPPHQLALPVTG